MGVGALVNGRMRRYVIIGLFALASSTLHAQFVQDGKETKPTAKEKEATALPAEQAKSKEPTHRLLVGVQLGANISQSLDKDISGRACRIAGLLGEYFFKPEFSIEFGLGYHSRRWQVSEASTQSDYLHYSLLLRDRFTLTYATPYLDMGFVGRSLLSGKFEQNGESFDYSSDYIESFNAALLFGLGVEIPVGGLGFPFVEMQLWYPLGADTKDAANLLFAQEAGYVSLWVFQAGWRHPIM